MIQQATVFQGVISCGTPLFLMIATVIIFALLCIALGFMYAIIFSEWRERRKKKAETTHEKP